MSATPWKTLLSFLFLTWGASACHIDLDDRFPEFDDDASDDDAIDEIAEGEADDEAVAEAGGIAASGTVEGDDADLSTTGRPGLSTSITSGCGGIGRSEEVVGSSGSGGT